MNRITEARWLRQWLGLWLFVALAACGTEPAPVAPTVRHGDLHGFVYPPNSIRTVTATSSAGDVSSVAPDPTTGDFTFFKLVLGVYTLHAVAAPGFVTPAYGYFAYVETGGRNQAGGIYARSTATGSVSGQVDPVGAVTLVTATGSSGAAAVTPEARLGVFILDNLVPGPYTLTFTPASGYAPPPARPISVMGGTTTSVGVIQVR
ncbi:hypothetical protein CDA63_19595 [Hymenobacter amundsenii]|uniref:Carboxypeptidase regulatory-like domain-containing protein n=1 Tax=Hymenobacter amundsenii TaxID=2006685 RepID=A0A246FFU6_9BACT|nr:carboxypeptidase-like regulatory domain-containing protein [Hymenobacter amundsenii]OWP61399.1 hypothetical protein CDA63_19595 [Hymenobacter amundsenii]